MNSSSFGLPVVRKRGCSHRRSLSSTVALPQFSNSESRTFAAY